MKFLSMLILMFFISSCDQSSKIKNEPEQEQEANNMQIGGLYSIIYQKNEFRVVKVAACDKEVIHINLYENVFAHRPESVDSSALIRAGGHCPIAIESLKRVRSSWKPMFIKTEKVTYNDLSGYRRWMNDEYMYTLEVSDKESVHGK